MLEKYFQNLVSLVLALQIGHIVTFFLLVMNQGRIYLWLGSLEPREMGNMVYVETTSTLQVKEHVDELEFLSLLNVLTLPHIKQGCPYAMLTKKAVGYCMKLLSHCHDMAKCTVFRRYPSLNKDVLTDFLLYSA